jgi:ABC-type transport system involved in cytochrome c biogenesis permease subunit
MSHRQIIYMITTNVSFSVNYQVNIYVRLPVVGVYVFCLSLVIKVYYGMYTHFCSFL